MSLEGKLALVTGSAGGIGRATALALAEAGADVVVNYRASRKSALALVDSIRQFGVNSIALQADVSNPGAVKSMFTRIEKQIGPVDILVNNVGDFEINSVAQTPYARWDYLIKSNLYSTFICSQSALKNMRNRKWGRIVNLTMAASEKLAAAPRIAVYAAAKQAVLSFTKSLAAEEIKNGITVNAVGPGIIDTGYSAAEKKELIRLCPSGRFGAPEEVARAIVFLCQPESGYITGTHLTVAGGWGL
jgi:3-oxoacyl-[acyl-carrier protein] reductase